MAAKIAFYCLKVDCFWIRSGHSRLKLNATSFFIKELNWHTDDTDYTDSREFLILI
jgi:hypothetical protein